MSSSAPRTLSVASGFSRTLFVLLATAILVAMAAGVLFLRRNNLPEPGSDRYGQVTRAFYHGLAALEVGLLDDARTQFSRATEMVAEEPASWANLAVAQLRLGELDAAAGPVARAISLAPDDAGLLLLAGRMEIARGRLDEGIAHLRRAVELDPQGLRTRFALAEEVERAGSDADALALLDQLVELAPGNPAVLVERARLAAKARDTQRLNDSMTRLQALVTAWPPAVGGQFQALQAAAASSEFTAAVRATTLMRNLLAAVPSFRESLSQVRTPTELVAEPLDRFVRLAPPPATPSPPDESLTYERQTTGVPDELARAADGALILDSNNDFRNEAVVGGDSGIPADARPLGAADVEMDGDLDIIAARAAGPVVVLRNNGTGDWTPVEMFAGVTGPRAFAWADLDQDMDPDAAFLDANGQLSVHLNRQAGDFVLSNAPARRFQAITAADIDADGRIDLVGLSSDGIRSLTRVSGEWQSRDVALWDTTSPAAAASRIIAADLDNNGALDLIVSGRTLSGIWLADEQHRVMFVSQLSNSEVTAAVDLTGDGLLDLVARTDGGAVRYIASAKAGYHWKIFQPRATTATGDQRINSFGVGGEVEVRSGLLVQKQILSGGPVHVGLGTQTAIDVARIVWPNGVAQAEFGIGVDDELVAEQRLKGSCPWVFAWDGTKMAFVTDFLWRSPLGLRINAQDTAGVTQTEDWVRIGGAQLAPKDGVYDLRITAELWETHFFDRVSLMVVDHPAGTEVYVDERFSPASPPTLAVHAVRSMQPVADARDHRGRDVTDLVAARDGRYLASFTRGRYQGIADDHFVEFAGPAFAASQLRRGKPARNILIATGWIYPTDSSINVAIGQGGHVTPKGLSLEAQGADGRWTVVNADVGFPAGKNKTILIDLAAAGDARRLRLRTNLEISWDSLAFADAAEGPPQTRRLALSGAELRYRGFSETVSPRGESPETPMYDRIATRTQRWRDLTGYHTRFGDVKPLLDAVDDRYVIMNAGDEMRLRFAELPPPPAGWRRDFVLIGDGWEKDGDYNTGFSDTVLPLPAHDTPDYGSKTTSLALEEDPVYQRHRQDWETYHTRYVAPTTFVQGLRRIR